MLRLFNLPNLFTASNMLCGSLAIIFTLLGRIDVAPFFIVLGALFDFLDGFLARKLGVQGELGKQLDSLADMITFGLAPGVLMFFVLVLLLASVVGTDASLFVGRDTFFFDSTEHYVVREIVNNWKLSAMDGMDLVSSAGRNVGWMKYLPFVALVIPFFSLFRLANFNVDTRQTDRFIGVPTPAATLFFLTFPLVLVYQNPEGELGRLMYQWVFHPIVLCVIMVLMSASMVSEIPLFSLKFKTFSLQENKLRYSFLLISLVFILVFKAWALALIVFLYLLLSILENIANKKKQDEI